MSYSVNAIVIPDDYTQKSQLIYDRLAKHYSIPESFLDYDAPFQLLMAVILSAQCTDALVNKVTPRLFKQYPTLDAIAHADSREIADCIHSINYYKTKAKRLVAAAQYVLTVHNGQIPSSIDDLIRIPGVGRKSANVMVLHVFHQPAITVDTHVKRVSQRLGLTTYSDATKIELDLKATWPSSLWSDLSSLLIMHGRAQCNAKHPKCAPCILADICRYPKENDIRDR